MNHTSLCYSFIDNSDNISRETNEPSKTVLTNKILNKLKPSKISKTDNDVGNYKPRPKITAFNEDDDEIKKKGSHDTLNPLMQNVEGLTNFNEQPQSVDTPQELLYDFNRHYNNTNGNTNAPIQYSLDNTTQEKINYIIHMLEQNRQLRTENITEEMIMYFFLGFFVLYISDNFVKMGKYTR